MKRLVETIRVKGVGTPQRAGPAWQVVFSPSEGSGATTPPSRLNGDVNCPKSDSNEMLIDHG